MERMTTKAKGGSIAGYPLEIDITSIICMNMMTKKYIFASFFANYSNKLNGMNVKQLYLEVLTLLDLTFLFLRRRARPSSLKSIDLIFSGSAPPGSDRVSVVFLSAILKTS